MKWMRPTIATLAAALLTGASIGGAAAQDAPTTVSFDEADVQGPTWALSSYFQDGSLVDVPDEVTATLLLEDGSATGEAGCNTFSTSYQIDAHLIAFDEPISRTEMACEAQSQEVEDAYLALLPTVVAWSIADGVLQMVDNSEMPVLVYDDGTVPIAVSELFALNTELEELRDTVSELTLRISNLEGEAGSDPAPEKKAKNKPRAAATGGKVERQFAERGEDPDRGLVTWRDRAKNEEGYRVYARRIQCVVKNGQPTEQPSKWVRVSSLPANAEEYRPRHRVILGQIAPQATPVVGSGTLYEVAVAPYNSAGSAKRTVVGAYFTDPEYSCG